MIGNIGRFDLTTRVDLTFSEFLTVEQCTAQGSKLRAARGCHFAIPTTRRSLRTSNLKASPYTAALYDVALASSRALMSLRHYYRHRELW